MAAILEREGESPYLLRAKARHLTVDEPGLLAREPLPLVGEVTEAAPFCLDLGTQVVDGEENEVGPGHIPDGRKICRVSLISIPSKKKKIKIKKKRKKKRNESGRGVIRVSIFIVFSPAPTVTY